MTALLFIAPLVLSLPVWFFRTRKICTTALLIHAFTVLISFLFIAFKIDMSGLPGWAAPYFGADALSLFFLGLMALVYAASAIYSVFYFRDSEFQPMQETVFTICLMLFVTVMSAAILSTHLAFFWVFLELTTLTTAILIYHDRSKSSLEAAWKYIFICSIGITLAFVGIIFLSLGSRGIGSLFISDLANKAVSIHPFWLKLAFAFILIGFGTKIGVAPIHAWLPDAHSEAPSPVSALLSGALLNTALIGFIRIYQIVARTEAASYAKNLTMGVGFLSLMVSAAFMLRTVNYKRMLAYSSIENMGIIFIGLGLGGGALYAAMLQVAAHSFAKTGLFLTSGNILHLYGSRRIEDVKGLLSRSPVTGWLWMISFLAISGMPPFPVFFSKFLLIQACFERSVWLALLFLVLLLIAFTGMAGAVMRMVFGVPNNGNGQSYLSGWGYYLPQAAMLFISLLIGLSIPGPVRVLIEQAARLNP
jgi:hydrogenase-4 component F